MIFQDHQNDYEQFFDCQLIYGRFTGTTPFIAGLLNANKGRLIIVCHVEFLFV